MSLSCQSVSANCGFFQHDAAHLSLTINERPGENKLIAAEAVAEHVRNIPT